MIICLCGKTNSGKSYISNLLENMDKNVIHVDIDKIAHDVINDEEVIRLIKLAFGLDVVEMKKVNAGNIDLNKDESVIKNLVNKINLDLKEKEVVNRKKLAHIVFNDKDEMKKLENITWNRMEKIIDSIIFENNKKIILLDYQLLPKTKYFDEADIRLLVKAPEEIRFNRAVIRDNIFRNQFDEREKASLNFVDSDFDYVIENDKNIYTLKKKVVKFYEESIVRR